MSWAVVAGAGNSFTDASSAANTFAEIAKDNGYVMVGYVVNDYIDFSEAWSDADDASSSWGASVSASNIWSAA